MEIALNYFRENDNEVSVVKEIFEGEIYDTFGRAPLENILMSHPKIFFGFPSPIGGGDFITFNVLPYVYTSIFTGSAKEFIDDYILEHEQQERKERLEIDQMQSVIDTNKSVKDTNALQRNILWITAGISAVTLLVSVLQLFKKETINVSPSPVILKESTLSKDSMTRLIQSLIPQKDVARKNDSLP